MTAVPALARLVRPAMNKTEAAYADHLEQLRRVDRIAAWLFEAVTLKLADDCRYTPDFLVVHADRTLELVEVKGFWRDDARVKIRVAAERFPWFRFTAVQRKQGAWIEEHFGAEQRSGA